MSNQLNDFFRKPRTREETIADDPLGKFFVWWDDINEEDIKSFEEFLQNTKTEHELQEFLQSSLSY